MKVQLIAYTPNPEQVRNVAPALFEHAGPPCVKGPCSERKMRCGKAAKMKQRYLGYEPG